jgi:hypothetical protein
MAERPRVVGICRRIWWVQPAPNLLSMKVRSDRICGRLCCNSGLLHITDLFLNYLQSEWCQVHILFDLVYLLVYL